jgi:hypothetical protein
MLSWVPVVVIGLVLWLVIRWLNRRDRRQREVQAQIWEMERQIWRESLPDWQREALEEADRQQVEIHLEARRRLGLPEEER